jgi:hypothetical protein
MRKHPYGNRMGPAKFTATIVEKVADFVPFDKNSPQQPSMRCDRWPLAACGVAVSAGDARPVMSELIFAATQRRLVVRKMP